MSDLEQKFNEMVTAVREASIDFQPNNTQKLKSAFLPDLVMR